jgi:hypothetical protein
VVGVYCGSSLINPYRVLRHLFSTKETNLFRALVITRASENHYNAKRGNCLTIPEFIEEFYEYEMDGVY